jgi:hypothetical protein
VAVIPIKFHQRNVTLAFDNEHVMTGIYSFNAQIDDKNNVIFSLENGPEFVCHLGVGRASLFSNLTKSFSVVDKRCLMKVLTVLTISFENIIVLREWRRQPWPFIVVFFVAHILLVIINSRKFCRHTSFRDPRES